MPQCVRTTYANERPTRAWAFIIVALATTLHLGCADSPSSVGPYDDGTTPLISGDPSRDGTALHEANRQLTEVRWQVIVTNQNGETAATYELLTMNAV